MIAFAANVAPTAAPTIANVEWPGPSSKIAASRWVPAPPSNTWFLGPTRVFIQNGMSIDSAVFGRPFVKRFALCQRTVVYLSVCPVCDVGVLWPNGWIDQDETWHAGRPRPRPHCAKWGPSSPSPKSGHSPQFSAHVFCGQMAGWIKMSLGTMVGLGPGTLC